MYLSDDECENGRRQLCEEEHKTRALAQKLRRNLFREPEIDRALKDRLACQRRLTHEIDQYERLKKGDLTAIAADASLGKKLVAMRILRGLSQEQMAAVFGVSEAQIVRQERSNYRALTAEAARKFLGLLDNLDQSAMSHGLPRSARLAADWTRTLS